MRSDLNYLHSKPRVILFCFPSGVCFDSPPVGSLVFLHFPSKFVVCACPCKPLVILPVFSFAVRLQVRVSVQPFFLLKYLSIHTWCVVIQMIVTLKELHPAYGLRDFIFLAHLQSVKSPTCFGNPY